MLTLQHSLGNPTLFVTGTDEHGMKVAEAASKQQRGADGEAEDVKQYCDRISKTV